MCHRRGEQIYFDLMVVMSYKGWRIHSPMLGAGTSALQYWCNTEAILSGWRKSLKRDGSKLAGSILGTGLLCLEGTRTGVSNLCTRSLWKAMISTQILSVPDSSLIPAFKNGDTKHCCDYFWWMKQFFFLPFFLCSLFTLLYTFSIQFCDNMPVTLPTKPLLAFWQHICSCF